MYNTWIYRSERTKRWFEDIWNFHLVTTNILTKFIQKNLLINCHCQGEKLWINQSVFTILFSNDDIILTTLLFIILKYWLQYSFTLEMNIRIQIYAGFTYQCIIEIIEIIPISGTASSQAERCHGQRRVKLSGPKRTCT